MQSVFVLALLAFGAITQAHTEVSWPPPLRSKYNSLSTNVDYSMTSPLSGAAQFPCKGYQSDLGSAAGGSVITYQAGQTYNFTVVGGATHGGGSCQASLSYDKGATFTVINSYIGSCPLTSGQSFDFTIPSDAKTGAALWGWTWFNQIGNREIYMNCASVTIAGGSSKRASSSTAFLARPGLFVANLANGCTSVEGKDVVFPNPGPDVVTKLPSGITDNSGSVTGTCAAVNGVGGGTAGAGTASGNTGSSSAASGASPATTASAPTLATSVAVSSVAASLPGGVFATTGTSASATAVAPVPIMSANSSSPVSPSSSAVSIPLPTATSSASSPASTGTTSTAGAQTGACTSEGMFNCIGGTSFQQCASGAWSVVQSVAAGTACTAGQSTNLDIHFATAKGRRTVNRHIARHLQN